MPDPLKQIAQQGEQTPAAEEPAKRQTAEEATGKTVAAARDFFAKVNKLDGAPEAKAEDKPKEESAPVAEKPAEKPATEPETPSSPIFGKKKSKKAEAREIADAVAEGNQKLIEAIQAKNEPVKPVEQKAATPPPEDDSDDLASQIRKLEEINPSYKGVTAKFEEFKKKEADYEAKWLAANPDEDFDPDSDEHAKFYERNEPVIKPSDLKKAEKELLREEARKEAQAAVEKQLAPIQQKQRNDEVQKRVGEKLQKTFAEVAKEAVAAVLPDFKGDDISKVAESDPLAAQVLSASANRWLPIIQSASLVYNGATVDENDPAVQGVNHMIGVLEEQVLGLPVADRTNKGKKFATLGEYAAMSRAEQARHWYIGEDEIVEYSRHRMASEAKSMYQQEQERIDNIIAARGGVQKSGHSQQKNEYAKPNTQAAFKPAPAVGGSSTPPPAPGLEKDKNLTPRVKVAKAMGW
jgi:hypothetical protein